MILCFMYLRIIQMCYDELFNAFEAGFQWPYFNCGFPLSKLLSPPASKFDLICCFPLIYKKKVVGFSADKLFLEKLKLYNLFT